jgi:hypothetical protein
MAGRIGSYAKGGNRVVYGDAKAPQLPDNCGEWADKLRLIPISQR